MEIMKKTTMLAMVLMMRTTIVTISITMVIRWGVVSISIIPHYYHHRP